MTTWGGFALIVCAFIVPPIVVLNRSTISSSWIWLISIPVVTVTTYLGVCLGPVIFDSMLGIPSWPSLASHLLMILVSFIFSILIAVTLFVVKRKSEQDDVERKRRIHKAIDKIMEDGVITAPKGEYVPHGVWGAGTDPGTPHETKEDGHGPYGLPMP